MIYIDGKHMVADSLKELDLVAEFLDMDKSLERTHKTGHSYYVIPHKPMRNLLFRRGARKVSTRWIVKFLNDLPHRAVTN